MQLATADAVQPRDGEAAFILQLRPPETAHADALAHELERFTSLYLERATAEHVRFTPLGALTWALCAPSESVEEVDAACDALALTLFGDPASPAVHLARQPDHPRQEDFRIQNQSLSEEEGESVMADLEEHEWDFAMSSDADEDPEIELEPEAEAETSAEAPDPLAALDEDEDSIDLDDFVPPAEEQDDWELERPLADEVVMVVEDEPVGDLSGEDLMEALGEDDSAWEASETLDAADEPHEEEVDAFLDAEDQAEPQTEQADDDLDLDIGFESDAEIDVDLEAEDAVLADEAEPADALADPVDPEAEPEPELETFDLDAEDSRPAQPGIWDEGVDTVDIDDIAASALHETRLGSNLDVAAELNAFREEMRAIARSIPSGGLDHTLSEFRSSLESLSGELGQRVDGAAQRIEAAVGQLDVDRYDAASHRVESAAALMETSIQEALEALRRAGSAMASPTASDMFEAQEQDSL